MQRRRHQWVAISGDVLIGVVEVRDLNHLSMLYIEASHHRKGVGHQLLTTALAECKQTIVVAKITVNSSHYTQPFYARHGFWQEGEETTTNGVISVPMALASVIPVSSPEPCFPLHRPNMRHFPVPSPSHP